MKCKLSRACCACSSKNSRDQKCLTKNFSQNDNKFQSGILLDFPPILKYTPISYLVFCLLAKLNLHDTKHTLIKLSPLLQCRQNRHVLQYRLRHPRHLLRLRPCHPVRLRPCYPPHPHYPRHLVRLRLRLCHLPR